MGLDHLHEPMRHGRIAGPSPITVWLVQTTVGHFLLDDMAQVQNVAARQLPKTAPRFRIQRSGQCGGEQCGGLVMRQRLQIYPVEIVGLPKFLYPKRNRFTITDRQHHFRGTAQHDLMQHERREVIEQVHVIDTDHYCRRRRSCGQRLDHATDHMQNVVARQPGPRSQSAEGKSARAGRADDPADVMPTGRGGVECFAGDPALSHPSRAANHDAGNARIRYRGFDESHLVRASGQRPCQPHLHSVRGQAGAAQRNGTPTR